MKCPAQVMLAKLIGVDQLVPIDSHYRIWVRTDIAQLIGVVTIVLSGPREDSGTDTCRL